jgi:hypothetical protein
MDGSDFDHHGPYDRSLTREYGVATSKRRAYDPHTITCSAYRSTRTSRWRNQMTRLRRELTEAANVV